MNKKLVKSNLDEKHFLSDGLFPEYFSFLREHKYSTNTIRGYHTDLEEFIHWYNDSRNHSPLIETLAENDIHEYKVHLIQETRHKSNTINRKLAALSSLNAWALSFGRRRDSFISNLRFLKMEKTPPGLLSRFEVKLLLHTAEELVILSERKNKSAFIRAARDLAIIVLLLNTKLRIGEVCALRVSDLIITKRFYQLQIPNEVSDIPRLIQLNRLSKQAIQDWLTVRPRSRSMHLFISRRTRDHMDMMTTSAVQRRITLIGRRAGVVVSSRDLKNISKIWRRGDRTMLL